MEREIGYTSTLIEIGYTSTLREIGVTSTLRENGETPERDWRCLSSLRKFGLILMRIRFGNIVTDEV